MTWRYICSELVTADSAQLTKKVPTQ